MVSQVPRQARILLVDDRVENLIALDAILSPLNQIVVSVQSGEAALEALRHDEFAVALLDIVMPGMSGLETATRIKHDTRTRDVPIIFLTAAIAQPEQPFLSYAAGAVDYLVKPFDPAVLQAKVAVFVDLYLKASQLREQADLLGGRGLAEQLDGRLREVEEALAALCSLPAVGRDAEATQLAARLAGRVDRLRDALDALGAGPGGLGGGPGGLGGGQPSMTGGVTGGVAPQGRRSQQSAGQPG
jgi:CheY-like chemotaxis protein